MAWRKRTGCELLCSNSSPDRHLGERLARGGLPLEEALSICRQIAAGLEAAHERGVIHRDIKPANVMITPVRTGQDSGLRAGET